MHNPDPNEEWSLEFISISGDSREVKAKRGARPFFASSAMKKGFLTALIMIILLLTVGLVSGPHTVPLSYSKWHTIQTISVLEREEKLLLDVQAGVKDFDQDNPFTVQQKVHDTDIRLSRALSDHKKMNGDFPEAKQAGEQAFTTMITYLKALAKSKNTTGAPLDVSKEEKDAAESVKVLQNQIKWMKEGMGL